MKKKRRTAVGTPTETPVVTSSAWQGLTPEERQQRELGATRLKERLSRLPFYAKASELHGDEYWAQFYESRMNP